MRLIVPTIHANGSGADRLCHQIEIAFGAIDEAISALKKTSPNPRDYDPDVFTAATEQHVRRMNSLTQLMLELERQAVAISDQRGSP